MKEPEKYKQPEEETTRLSEPTVAYNSMAYLELEAEKAELIRTIENKFNLSKIAYIMI